MRQLLNSSAVIVLVVLVCFATDIIGNSPKFCGVDGNPEFCNVPFINSI